MRRREFFQKAGLTIGAATVLPSAVRGEGEPRATTGNAEDWSPGDWSWVRDQFPLSRSHVHMATFLLASHPRPVAQAIARHRRKLDENPAGYWHEQLRVADARQRAAAAEYMGASADDVALTDSTTMGLGLLYGSLHLEPGQEAVCTTHDHYSTQMALRHRAERSGVAVREVPLYADPSGTSVEEIVDNVRRAVSDRTRVLAVTWVHSCTGVKLPLGEIAEAVREINASRDVGDRVLFCVDGVHGFGIENVTMEDLGCDFFVAGTHKWIFGPRGTGVVWGRPEAWSAARPIIPSFGPNYEVWLGERARDQVPMANLMTPGGFHSFEHRWALEEAFRFHLRLGKSRVEQRIHELNTVAKEQMARMDHVTLHTPMGAELSSGIICFEVAGLEPDEVVARFHERGIIASTSPYRVSYPRIAPSLINDEDEIDRTMRVLRDMA